MALSQAKRTLSLLTSHSQWPTQEPLKWISSDKEAIVAWTLDVITWRTLVRSSALLRQIGQKDWALNQVHKLIQLNVESPRPSALPRKSVNPQGLLPVNAPETMVTHCKNWSGKKKAFSASLLPDKRNQALKRRQRFLIRLVIMQGKPAKLSTKAQQRTDL